MSKINVSILSHPFDSPSVQYLLELLQSEYVGIYGEEDPTEDPGLEGLEHPNGDILVAIRQDTYVPVGLIAWRPLTDRPDVAVMRRTYTHFRARRQGLAHELVAAAEQSARAAGMRQMWLEHGTAQTSARALYVSSGYVPELAEPYGHYAQFADTTSIFLGKDL